VHTPRYRVAVVCHEGTNRERELSGLCTWSEIGETAASIIRHFQAEPEARNWWLFRVSTRELSRREERLVETYAYPVTSRVAAEVAD